MEFWTSVRVVAGRWYVVLATLIAFAALGTVLVRSVEPRFDAAGSVVLLQESQPTDEKSGPINPFQTADYQANQFALIMEEALTNDVTRDQLEQRGVRPDYTITNSTNQTPVLFLTVHASSAPGATTGYATLVDQLRRELQARQASVGAPTQTYYTAVDLSVPATPEAKMGSRIQAGLFIGIIGITVAIGLALLVEAVTGARRARRALAATAAAHP